MFQSEAEFTEAIRNLDPASRERILGELEQLPALAPQSGPQHMAYHHPAQVMLFGGAAGGGKAESFPNKVATPFGLVRIGDLKPGDKVCDPFGGVQTVNATRDWKDWPVFRVQFSDGTHVDCAPEHEWTGWWSRHGTQQHQDGGRKRLMGPEGAVKLETQQIKAAIQKGGLRSRFRIPLCEPTAGNYNRYQIDPYALGALIGDGHFPKNDNPVIAVHHADEAILKRIEEGMEGFKWKQFPSRPNMIQGRLSKKSPDYRRLRALGYNGKRAWEKSLPSAALHTPQEWRWALLQGLMDTDGWVEPERCAYYCTTSPHLRDDVAALARSLGCFVTIADKHPTYTYKGEKLQGRPSWTLRIKSATPEELFWLPRKRAIAATLEHQSLAKEITAVEDLHECQTLRCISVSHPSGLYVTEGFTATHNSSLLIMLLLQEHQRSVLYRADAEQMAAMLYEIEQFVGTVAGRSVTHKRWHLPGNRYLEWAGLQQVGAEAKRQGQPFDFIGVDECTEIQRWKIEFVRTWNRTTTPGQRVRTILTCNPPGGNQNKQVDGRWVIDMFKPWIMRGYDNPAKSGDMRWFVRTPNDPDVEVKDDQPVEVDVDGEIKMMAPESRTFIQSKVQDNRFLAGTGYEQQLQALAPHLRAIYYEGDFSASIEDQHFQVIPSNWVDLAMGRWSKARVAEQRMSAMGVDVARGGSAQTVLSPRHGWHWNEFIKIPGRECINGPQVRDRVMLEVRDDADIIVDANGNGASAYDHLNSVGGLTVVPSVGTATKSREFLKLSKIEDVWEFTNTRTLLHWLLRKVLDPANGLMPALPLDTRLRRQLIAPTFEVRGNKLAVETKELVEEKLGTSLDEADAVMLSLATCWREEGFVRLLPTKRRRLEQMRAQPANAEEKAKRPFYSRAIRRRLGGRMADPLLMM